MKKYFQLAIFLTLFFFSYIFIFPGNFHYDDHHHIVENPSIRSLKNISRIFKDPSCFSAEPRVRMYRPILLLSYAFDYQLYGLKSWGFHLSGLLIHLLNCFLVFSFSKKILDDRKAYFAMFIFAFHPVSFENVNYISSRSSILVSFFILLSLNLYVLRNSGYKGVTILGSLLFFVLALLTKSSSVVFPGVIFLYEMLFGAEGGFFKRFKNGFLASLGYLVVLIFYLVLRWFLFGHPVYDSAPIRPIYENLLTESKAYIYYIWLFLNPLEISLEHSFGLERSVLNYRVVLSIIWVVILVSLVLISFFKRENIWKIVGFGTGFYLLFLLPTSSIVPLNQLVNERTLYLPLVVLGVLMGEVFFIVGSRFPTGSYITFLILVSIYLSMGVYRSFLWQDEQRLWFDAFKKAPDNYRAVQGLADVYYLNGSLKDSLLLYKKTLFLNPNNPSAYENLGVIISKQGNPREAIGYLLQALKLSPHSYRINHNLGLIYYQIGDKEKALQHLWKAITINPHYAPSYNFLGEIYLDLKKLDDAQGVIEYAISLSPNYAPSHYNLGLVYMERGLYERACDEFLKALKFSKDDPDYWYSLGLAQEKLGRLNDALRSYQRAEELKKGIQDFIEQ